ncbi:kinase-like domain-containing protein [Tanacetum coccineum]
MLARLYLYSNKLEGHIPSSLGNCKELNGLALRYNRLSGKIPKQILQLPSLTNFLDLSFNSLSGSIPSEIKDLKMLSYLDLSYNNLSGTITSSLVFANASAFSVLGNNRLCGGSVTLELPKCKEKGSKKKRFPFFISVIVIAPTLFIVLCCVYSFCKKKRNGKPSQSSGNERFLKVSYNQLLKATDGFSVENLIGEGGFSSVYKGILNCDDDDDRFVAVKVLHLQNQGAHKSFLAECEVWRNIPHRNLLKIITSCSSVDFQGNDFKALVYEFMPNGRKIPQFLDKWNSLEFLNLFFNDFEGKVPVTGVFANARAFSVLGNNRLCGGSVTLELPKCKEKGSKKKRFPFFISVIVIAPTLFIVLCCVYSFCKKKRNGKPSQSSGNERFLKVSYNQLLKATDGFSVENLIGEGGLSSVYKGILNFDDE